MKASVITREMISNGHRDLVIAAIEPLSSLREDNVFWIGPKELIRSSTPSRSIGIQLLSGLPHVDEMTIGEKVNFCDTFGFEPRDVVGLKTFCAGDNEEIALGRCILAVAQAIQGIICFCGALKLPNARSVARSDRPKRFAQEAATNRVFSDLPGLVRVIPFEETKGQLKLAHYCNVEFMKSWIENPYFHMAA